MQLNYPKIAYLETLSVSMISHSSRLAFILKLLKWPHCEVTLVSSPKQILTDI